MSMEDPLNDSVSSSVSSSSRSSSSSRDSEENGQLNFSRVVSKKTVVNRQQAGKCFLELLNLIGSGQVTARQDTPYGKIMVGLRDVENREEVLA